MADKSTARLRALVTGASSGLGAAFAERLARDGYDLILVARRRDRLDSLAKKLEAEHHVQVDVLAADLSKPADIRKVEKRLAEDQALSLLVNNAGFGAYMPFVELDPDRAEELINVQVLAVTRLTRAALPGMIQRAQGAIINVSSRLGFSRSITADRLPKRATYAGTKAFINTFTQILQGELEGTGVRVQALCPGVVQTEFHERVGVDPNRIPAEIVMSPEDVVTASLAGLKSGEVVCVPALDDPAALTQIWESERKMLEQSGSKNLAKRYIT
jgi:short-subunit dehydrogenase